MKVVNLHKMRWFRRIAQEELKRIDDWELAQAYKEIISDYDWNINDIERLLNAPEEINQPQSV